MLAADSGATAGSASYSRPVASPIRPCIQATLSMQDSQAQALHIPDYLREIPTTFWATHSTDTGFIDCTPYKAVLKQGTRSVFCKQYPLSREREEGIQHVIDCLLEQGVIVHTTQPVRTRLRVQPEITTIG